MCRPIGKGPLRACWQFDAVCMQFVLKCSKKDPRFGLFDLIRMALVTALPSCRAGFMLVTIAMHFAGCTGLMESAIPAQNGSLLSSNSKENHAFLLATTKACRYQEMLREFHKAAPNAKTMSIRHVAHAIDAHEHFDKPDILRCEVAWGSGVLKLHHASPGDKWFVDWKTFGTDVPENQQKALVTAINKQIEKQKTLFPTRKKVMSAADDHLSQCLKGQNGKPVSPEALESLILQLPSPKAQRAQCEDAYVELFDCFGLFFEELESQGIQVKDAVLDCWKPLSLQLATSWYSRFRQLEDQSANQTAANATCVEKVHDYARLELYDTWQRTKAYAEKVADF